MEIKVGARGFNYILFQFILFYYINIFLSFCKHFNVL